MSDEPSTIARRWIPLALIGVVVGLVLWLRPSSPAPPGVEATLTAYADTIASGDLDEAWQAFTSPGYRQRTSQVVYWAAQASNEERHGTLSQIRISDQPAHRTHDEEGTRVVRVIALWEGTDDSSRVAFDFVPQGDDWRIHRSWTWPEGALAFEHTW